MTFDSIFFRVDAHVGIGMGHAKRCFIIARELLKSFNGKIYFLATDLPNSFQEEIKSYGIDIIFNFQKQKTELEFISYAVANKGNTALIIDSYEPVFYEENFQKEIYKKLTKLAYIVFDKEVHYYAHLLHNQNPLSLSLNFSVEPYTKCLFGLQNLILDEGFRQIAKDTSTNYSNTKGLVALLTFGGSDPNNLTLKTLGALSLINEKFEKIIVVIGGMYQNEKALMNFITHKRMNIEVHKDTDKMHKLILNSNIAFVSGGITTWELGALGVPVIILPAGNKEYASAKNLHNFGLAQLIENPLELSNSDLANTITDYIGKDLKKISSDLKREINIDGVENFVSALFE